MLDKLRFNLVFVFNSQVANFLCVFEDYCSKYSVNLLKMNHLSIYRLLYTKRPWALNLDFSQVQLPFPQHRKDLERFFDQMFG